MAKQAATNKAKARADVAPLYTVAPAQECLKQFDDVAYGAEFKPHDDVRVRFQDAGHILGSASVTEFYAR